MRTSDPRIRQTWNQVSQNLENANESVQAGLFSFTQSYINPCLSSTSGCLSSATSACFPDREERLRRARGRSRGRAEYNFDFYSDWEAEGSTEGILGWGNDELDRLLGASGARGVNSDAPGRKRAMSYGARNAKDARPAAGRRKLGDTEDDPTIIPRSSMFGFLGAAPWRIFGGRGLRYKPSAADLQEHPGSGRYRGMEGEPLLEESDGSEGSEDTDGREGREGTAEGRAEGDTADEADAGAGRDAKSDEGDGGGGGDAETLLSDIKGKAKKKKKKKRPRSNTSISTSETTTDSFRSRGDLIPSEDEDDAVVLGDEFSL
ncbi:MAG: hypothetical protein M1829_003818 [Trizodia sp. TS-e1964]|nr:MAG: hypothetical protein M1829_003818 [Trizodia sp. TS-e1964]